MWNEAYRSYVERHLRFYYKIPDDVVIYHGQSPAEEACVVVNDCGKFYFEDEAGEKPFRLVGDLPVLFKTDDEPLILKKGRKVFISADLFAAIFYLMSGWQELFGKDASRFQSHESWQNKVGSVGRALADDYFHLLAQAVEMLTGTQIIPRKIFNAPSAVFLSHDIDKLKSGRTEGVFRELKKGKLLKAVAGILNSRDPWFNLMEIAQLEKSLGVNSTFFMLGATGRHTLGNNADYKLESTSIQKILRDLIYMGSEVAVHGSLGTHCSVSQLQIEIQKLPQPVMGNRFHFLNYDVRHSVSVLEQCGVKYDASLGFPDRIGFRNGMSRPYKLFNFSENRISELIEIPLHAMDTTLQHSKYMDLNPADALQEIHELHMEVVRHGGAFSLLWHNNYFSPYKYSGWRQVYLNFIKQVSGQVDFISARDLAERYADV